MTESTLPPARAWLAAPLDADVARAIERLRAAPDVQRLAVMPDVHLAEDVCIGVVLATSRLIYPQAVGSDIGCGMLAVAFDVNSSALADSRVGGLVLAGIARAVPATRRRRDAMIRLPEDLEGQPLSHPRLDSILRKEGAVEFGTLGSGNHFVELQSDEGGRLWLMVHTGSRGVGQAIRDHHLEGAERTAGSLKALDSGGAAGQAYLADLAWARRFADANRRTIAMAVGAVVGQVLEAGICWDTAIAADHNHVDLEEHEGRALWVHRKGAMGLMAGQAGVLPGSMGTVSFHVEGRGEPAALRSSAHGAGRVMSRSAARRAVSLRALSEQMRGVWFDYRHMDGLRDEAPAAYKDVRVVLRAEHDLVKITRTLRPVLNYKGL